MKLFITVVILCLSVCSAVIAEEQVATDNALPQQIIDPPVSQPPVVETPAAEIPAQTPEITVTPPVSTTPEPVKDRSGASQGESNRDRDRNHRRDRDDDRKKDDWKKYRDKDRKYHRPHVVYKRAPPKVVYIYPQSYYPVTRYTETYITTIPSDYAPTLRVGGFLPPERQWRPLTDFALYGLPAPRRDEIWMYNDRDAVLINDRTSRIISAFVLATSID